MAEVSGISPGRRRPVRRFHDRGSKLAIFTKNDSRSWTRPWYGRARRGLCAGTAEEGTFAWIPGGVFSRQAFMIPKESRSIAMKSLRQEQSLLDHGDAVEVVYVLNPEFPV